MWTVDYSIGTVCSRETDKYINKMYVFHEYRTLIWFIHIELECKGNYCH